ncbi:hypothetical protein [Psychromonas aquatilis]|uniref:Uncharacterized protein n=1 Tax=Psychromonas aquatilis TaxID=2005072 RepID=A0ABU9GR15_9GAMM
MAIIEKREDEIKIKLYLDSKEAYKHMIHAFHIADLRVTSEDEHNFSAIAESSKLKSLVKNSYGEVVTFIIKETESNNYCFVTLSSKGKSPLGGYSHKSIFTNIENTLKRELGADMVELTLQDVGSYIEEETLFEILIENIDRQTIRKLAEKNSGELQDIVNAGGNVYQVSLEQQDKLTDFAERLSEKDAAKFLTIYNEELGACSNKRVDDLNIELQTEQQNNQAVGMVISIIFIIGIMFFIFR